MQNYQTKFFFTTKKDANLAFHVGDKENSVINNHKNLAHKHNYNLNKLVYMQQVHSDKIHIINEKDDFWHPPTCDALISNKKNIPLMVMVADCTPIILRDDIKGVIGVIHAGRAGAFKNILTKTITSMQEIFHSHREDIKVDIGPSIKVCCYEVGEEILQEAKTLQLDYAIETRGNKLYLNIAKILDTQLKDCKILHENIHQSHICNCCSSDKYYSYRVSQKTGRFAGVVHLS